METLIVILLILCLVCFIRALVGPTLADRMVAVDILGIIVVGLCVLLAVKFKREFLVDVAFAWIFLSFIGTIALAKYLEKKKLDE